MLRLFVIGFTVSCLVSLAIAAVLTAVEGHFGLHAPLYAWWVVVMAFRWAIPSGSGSGVSQ